MDYLMDENADEVTPVSENRDGALLFYFFPFIASVIPFFPIRTLASRYNLPNDGNFKLLKGGISMYNHRILSLNRL
jgi:hypothetical protein